MLYELYLNLKNIKHATCFHFLFFYNGYASWKQGKSNDNRLFWVSVTFVIGMEPLNKYQVR